MYPPGGRQGPVGPYQQPQYQQPQDQQPWAVPGAGRLVIEAKCSWLVLPQRLFGRPEITINGSTITGRWGVNSYDMWAGEHEVQVLTDYIFSFPMATYAVVPIRAGMQTHLYYKAPVFYRRAGALDGSPQGYPGMGTVIAGYVAFAVVLLVVVAVVLYLSFSG